MSSAEKGGEAGRLGPRELHSQKVLATVLGFTAGFIELCTTADMCHGQGNCAHSRIQFALWAGIIGVIMSLSRLIMFRAKPTVVVFDLHLSFLLTVLWSFAVAFNTSSGGPFTKTNNGYYSTWLALISAVYFAYLSLASNVRETVHSELGRQNFSLLILFFASLVEMAVAADVCDNEEGCKSREAGATVIGLFSVLGVGTHILMVRQDHSMVSVSSKGLAVFAVVIWSIGAGINTSDGGPFTSSCDARVPAANGYFATWAAFFAALHFAWAELLTVLPDGFVDRQFGIADDLQVGLSAEQPYQPLPTAVET